MRADLTQELHAGSTRAVTRQSIEAYRALVGAPVQLAALGPDVSTAAVTALGAAVELATEAAAPGDAARWLEAIEALGNVEPLAVELDRDGPRALLGPHPPAARMLEVAKALMPWRKGPFQLGELWLDAEWVSAHKWERFRGAVDFTAKRVLDVGAGNGYFALRALGAGASSVLAVDPSPLYNAQWALLRRVFHCQRAALLPLRLDQVPASTNDFDVVLSMGVLYHQRDPEQHLRDLRRVLGPRGKLVLETLIVAGDDADAFRPPGRYAAMRNVWYLPTRSGLERWIRAAGFSQSVWLHVAPTTPAEQRRSPFMQSPSLADFLDPDDPTRTREGHPAPVRAVVLVE